MISEEEIYKNIFPLRKPLIPCVYFLFNDEKEIVYVGNTKNFWRRLYAHSKNKKCSFSYASYIRIESKLDRAWKETDCIFRFKPVYNLKGNPDWEEQRDLAIQHLLSSSRENEIYQKGLLSWRKTRDVIEKELGQKMKTYSIAIW